MIVRLRRNTHLRHLRPELARELAAVATAATATTTHSVAAHPRTQTKVVASPVLLLPEIVVVEHGFMQLAR